MTVSRPLFCLKKTMINYNFKLDLIRALAIMGVVAIHVWYPVYSRPDFLGGLSWWLAYVINSVSRVAVPWFLLVSGALLLPRHPRQEIKDVANRLIKRLGLPLVFWSIVYFWWDSFYTGQLHTLLNMMSVLTSGSIFHLYFLVILFGLYLFLPAWRRLKISRTLLLVSFLLGILLYILQFFVFRERTIFNFLTLWVPYLGYFLAGPYLMGLKNVSRGWVWSCWAIAVGLTLISGYINLALLNRGIATFWGIGGTDYFTHWLTPNVIIMSLTAFYWIIHCQFNLSGYLTRAVKSIARVSFGIYLVHPMVINLADKYLGLYLDYGHTRLWWYGSYKYVLVFLLSYLVTVIMIKLPLVKALMGEKKWY